MKGKKTLGILGFVLFFKKKKKSLFDEEQHSFSLEQRSIMALLLEPECIFSSVPGLDCWEQGNVIQLDALELLLFDKNFKKCFGRGHFLDSPSASESFTFSLPLS